jgi:hypothetical protein
LPEIVTVGSFLREQGCVMVPANAASFTDWGLARATATILNAARTGQLVPAAMLRECADELAAEIGNRYAGVLDYPAMQGRYERDMDTVNRARALLDKAGDARAE